MTCIEELSDAATLAMPLGTKTFNPEKEADTTKHHGKVPFATKIIEPHAGTIFWDGSEPPLARIVAVLDDYAAKVTPDAVRGLP